MTREEILDALAASYKLGGPMAFYSALAALLPRASSTAAYGFLVVAAARADGVVMSAVLLVNTDPPLVRNYRTPLAEVPVEALFDLAESVVTPRR